MKIVVKRINDEVYDTKNIIFFNDDEVEKVKELLNEIKDQVQTFYVFDRIKNQLIVYLTDGYYDPDELNKIINKYITKH